MDQLMAPNTQETHPSPSETCTVVSNGAFILADVASRTREANGKQGCPNTPKMLNADRL